MDIKLKFESNGRSLVISKDSRYRLLSITGIGEYDNELVTTPNVAADGSEVNNKKIKPRDIFVEAEYTGANQKEERKRITSFFNVHHSARLIVTMNNTSKAIGYNLDNLSAPLKNVNQPLKFLVSLYCPSPFFEEIQEKKEEIATWQPNFSFPLSIPEEGIEMGYREPSLIVNVFNSGDVETGMTIKFRALGTLENPELFNVNTREFFKINTTMQPGDVITVTTQQFNKRIELERNGVVSNYFNWMDWGSTFLQLDPGDNLFRYDAKDGLDNLEVDIYHTSKSLGV